MSAFGRHFDRKKTRTRPINESNKCSSYTKYLSKSSICFKIININRFFFVTVRMRKETGMYKYS